MSEIIEIDASKITDIKVSEDLLSSRKNVTDALKGGVDSKSEVTVLVQAYNRLEKTKRCVESIFKYTNNINYDLILIDNGSTDKTFEYFKSLKGDNIRILHFNENHGSLIPSCFMNLNMISNYFISLGNDIIVTENWLSNLITVAKSDDRIGMVCPMSSNVSNMQQYNLTFKNYEDMQIKAAKFNKSDPTKWQERLRLITVATLYKKECLYAIGWPINDVGFTHDFCDDDISFKVRRAGYKTILAGDTWLHHDHDYKNLEDKNLTEFQKSLSIGKLNFQDKYWGVDAWDDASNFVFSYIEDSVDMPSDIENVKLLGIDAKCGTPILDLKNIIRSFGAFSPEVNAYTSESKYDIDLKTICNGQVICDRIDFIYNSFKSNSFDYIIFGKNINEYHQPEKVIRDTYALLKSGGQMFISIKNTYNIFTMLTLLGHKIHYHESVTHISIDELFERLANIGIETQLINKKLLQTDETIQQFILNIVGLAKPVDKTINSVFDDMITDKFWIKIVKKANGHNVLKHYE